VGRNGVFIVPPLPRSVFKYAIIIVRRAEHDLYIAKIMCIKYLYVDRRIISAFIETTCSSGCKAGYKRIYWNNVNVYLLIILLNNNITGKIHNNTLTCHHYPRSRLCSSSNHCKHERVRILLYLLFTLFPWIGNNVHIHTQYYS